MKKSRFLMAIVAFAATFCCACQLLEGNSSPSGDGSSISDTGNENSSGSQSGGENDDISSSSGGGQSGTGNGNSGGGDGADNSSDNSGNSSGGSGGDVFTHTYTDFTASEKETLITLLGETIPFIPNDEYKFSVYSQGEETGVDFYTIGNTMAEFNAYREAFSNYIFLDTEVDDEGDTWYYYGNDDYYVDMCIYEWDGDYIVQVYAYLWSSTGGDSGNEGGGSGDTEGYLYADFTDEEKSNFIQLFGEVIPFVANNEYFVDDYAEEGLVGYNFYTFGNTQTEFNAYRNAFSSYDFVESYEDDYGDIWYVYQKGELYVDFSYYEADGDYCIDVYAYVEKEPSGGGSTGGGSGSGSEADADVIINDGKGLPVGVNGVYDVDFTQATNVKDVTDQGYYSGGCPTVGKAALLVIPVEFSDVTAQSKGYDIATLKNAFEKNGNTDYYSLYDYYYKSSGGKLDLDITVLDRWFKPKNTSSYYKNLTMDYYEDQVAIGDQAIMDEALAFLAGTMDLSAFDSDGNGIIDAVVLINTLDIDSDSDFHWAYRYWNIYTDDQGYYYEYDGVSANDYLWASYQFLHEDERGGYDDVDGVNTYTYIHEFGHVLGADDYYDTAYVGAPMGGFDVMDSMMGDHNAYTKFNYGWITTSRLVTTESEVCLTLGDFSKTGETIILANHWDSTLGAYQEYYIVAYYKNGDLNSGAGGYFNRDGIVVYHVNASLYKEEIDGEIYYDVYNNNTDATDEYGTANNLIEYVLNGVDTYTYGVGDSLPETTLDGGAKLQYTFTVDALTDDEATITFTKRA